MPPGDEPLWSILIATVAWREARFLRLLASLLPQAEACFAPVEVVALQNNGSRPLGEYREALLRDARGKYLCFVDDDDAVPDDYAEVLADVMVRHDPDVIGFRQACTGLDAPVGILSLRNPDPPGGPVGGVYYRMFTHMMPVRTSIARKGSFLGSAHGWTGEDMAYVRSVVPHLYRADRREAFIDREMYTYRWDPADTTQAGPVRPELTARYAGHPLPPVGSPCFRWCEWKS